LDRLISIPNSPKIDVIRKAVHAQNMKQIILLCCSLAPVGSSDPASHSLTFPQWHGGENQKGKSETVRGLR